MAIPLIPALALAATGLAGGITAFGQVQSANAASEAAKYNSQISAQNAKVAQQNAAIAGQSGAEQASMSELRTRATEGAIKANEGASGVDVNSGSAVSTQASAEELGQLDALTIRSNATREAYGYQTQQASFQNESNLEAFEAENDTTAGEIGAAGTLIGSAAQAGSQYELYKMNGGLSY